MPYIRLNDRSIIDQHVECLSNQIKYLGKLEPLPQLGIQGPLNYAITKLLIKTCPAKKYWAFVLVIGTLFMVAFEFYRRMVAPYEDIKKEENGDVGYDELK